MKSKNRKNKRQSALVQHAKDELERAGLFDKDSDYSGMLGRSVLEIVELFSSQGHSGMSAALATDIATRLMRYELLTPLKNPMVTGEYMDLGYCYDKINGVNFQSTRDASVFSNDGGKTWYDLDKEDWKSGIIKFINRHIVYGLFKIDSKWMHARKFKILKFKD